MIVTVAYSDGHMETITDPVPGGVDANGMTTIPVDTTYHAPGVRPVTVHVDVVPLMCQLSISGWGWPDV